MTLHNQLDPEIAEAVQALPIPDLDEHMVRAIRGIPMPAPALSDAVARQEAEVPGSDAGDLPVPVRVHAPAERTGSLPGVLAIHGGGYVIGDRTMYDGLFDRWCVDPGMVAVSVGYRLAPETPYPGPLEDCYRALVWTAAHADELGIDPSCIGIYGASAGGGLAAGLALLARDRGDVDIAFQFLQYPMLDDRQITDSSRLDDLYVWSRRSNSFGWKAYLGDLYGGDHIPAYAAAARAEDLGGLPPAYVCVGALDGFRDEDIDYARRLLQAGRTDRAPRAPRRPPRIRTDGGLGHHPSVDVQRRRVDPAPAAGTSPVDHGGLGPVALDAPPADPVVSGEVGPVDPRGLRSGATGRGPTACLGAGPGPGWPPLRALRPQPDSGRGGAVAPGVGGPPDTVPPSPPVLTAGIGVPSGWRHRWRRGLPSGVGQVPRTVPAGCGGGFDGDQLPADGEPVDEGRDGQEVDQYDQEDPQDLLLAGQLPLPLRASDDVHQCHDEHDQ